MDNSGFLWAITIFVAIAAVSMIAQAVATIRMFRAVQALQDKVLPLIPKTESLLETTRESLAETRKQVAELSAKTNAILDSTRTQLVRIDEVMSDATTRAKAQLERIDLVMGDTVNRVHETVSLLHNGVLRPVRELNGISAGLRAAVGAFFGGGRRSSSSVPVTHDEEMFI
ncbi:MAG: hypothetical protein MUC42_06385 [Bryobacter sp.]|nr:hypothetical protein [Bryobacter sp.]